MRMKFVSPWGGCGKVSAVARAALSSTFLILSLEGALAQTFSSGSTGADGALNITAPGITVFDPAKYSARTNNIYNFTTITIAIGSTLKISGGLLGGPVYFLATGDVNLNGPIDVSGEAGTTARDLGEREPSIPGPGGYPGGLGGTAQSAATAGGGPGGGAPATLPGTGGLSGVYTGTRYLVPLVGGSGGGGALKTACDAPGAASGGAGGGAILVASSTSITVQDTGGVKAAGGANAAPGCEQGVGAAAADLSGWSRPRSLLTTCRWTFLAEVHSNQRRLMGLRGSRLLR
jgi:hypothetical protein